MNPEPWARVPGLQYSTYHHIPLNVKIMHPNSTERGQGKLCIWDPPNLALCFFPLVLIPSFIIELQF